MPAQKAALDECLEQPEFNRPIDFGCSVKLLVLHSEILARKVIESTGGDGRNIPTSGLVEALYQIGQYTNKSAAEKLLSDAGGSLDDDEISPAMFKRILAMNRERRLLKWRSTFGFDESDLKRFRVTFDFRAASDGRKINHQHVLLFLDDLGFALDSDIDKAAFMKVLMRGDREGTGTVSFHEILPALRHLDNARQRARRLEVQEGAATSGLAAEEVQQLREAFKDYDKEDDGMLSKTDVLRLLSQLGVVHTYTQRQFLKAVMDEIAGEGDNHLTFPCFLKVLKKLDASGKF